MQHKNNPSLFFRNFWFWISFVLLFMLLILSFKAGYVSKFANIFSKNDVVIASNPEYLRRISVFKNSQKQDETTIFLGDSIVAGYNWSEKLNSEKIVNRGVSGARIEDLTDNIKNLNISNPKKIILLIGINDIAGVKNVHEIFKEYRNLVSQIKKEFPTAELILTSILPINENMYNKINVNSKLSNDSIKEFNSLLSSNFEDYRIINFNDSISDKNGNLKDCYTFDGLHVTGEVYDIWLDKLSL